jgi:bifunctional UDP-N-acetylglucosamine pyrophosphorylase/glucosamine-1-phosphate N-acetyltransferase
MSPIPPGPSSRPTAAVVLAAGKGTRMKSERPKVLHDAAGRPLLGWVLEAARAAGCARISVVVGHGAAEVRARFADEADLEWVEQREQLGTGHALAQAAPTITGPALLLVLSGDVPLIRPETLARLIEAAAAGWGAMAVATLEAPGSLGRVIGDGHGLERIVEARDASAEELAVRRVNAGLYALPAPDIFEFLTRLAPDNAQGELYLTDAVTAAARAGHRVALVELDDPQEALGVNDRLELAGVHRRLVERRIGELARAGVTFLDPATTTVEAGVTAAPDTVVHGGVHLLGATALGRGVTVHAGAWLRDAGVEDGASIEPYSVVDGARVGPGCRVGPFARLRPKTVLEAGARVGNFVEVKASTLGPGAKANHLAYVGDARVGARANLGAGVVTCNYDGREKHRTEIGPGAFVGSDTMLVAPVKVGADATTAAGSVITKDVPDGALAVERTPQRNVPGWAARRKHTARDGGHDS